MTKQVFVEAVAGVNVSNGVVRMMMVEQDFSNNVLGPDQNGDVPEPRHCQTVVMPLAGFLYSLSVFANIMNDEKMVETIKQMQAAGLLPQEKNDGNSTVEETSVSSKDSSNEKSKKSAA
ncbi:MAG: hypothetical protein V7776_22670 [Halopseudomonas aestusnigri]